MKPMGRVWIFILPVSNVFYCAFVLNCEKLLTETLISANIFYRKRCYRKATVRLSYVVIKKSNLTLVRAVAFLMSFISSGLPDTDHRGDNADDRHYNTGKFQNHSEHQ